MITVENIECSEKTVFSTGERVAYARLLLGATEPIGPMASDRIVSIASQRELAFRKAMMKVIDGVYGDLREKVHLLRAIVMPALGELDSNQIGDGVEARFQELLEMMSGGLPNEPSNDLPSDDARPRD